ncbi:hypothetical protein B7P43_G05157 [Cryptotermes secundus]|uniref:Mos1 transposase HTH domain-containing protein n=1 Tax=Cryptotermes secundus TaxID=105785 RepID=A0A2J7PEW5_9NEOP|nr:hypothetical protein B7P43_G05157 [Cryptotermes secundus]
MKFYFKLGKTAAETHQMLKQAFGDNSLGQTQTYDWYKRFKNGRTSTDDDDCSGRLSTGTTPENVMEVTDLTLQDRRLTKQDGAVVPHLPYSPDLAPCNFFLFPKMKIKLKGRRFLTKKDFQDAFEKWQKRWDRCMHSQGDYFEGDGAE